MDGESWYINNLTSLAIYYLTNIFFLVFLQLNLSIICFCKCKIYCFCLPRTVAFIAVAMFLRSNTYALRPSLCVGIPRQINSLTQGHCEGRPSVGLGTRMSRQMTFSYPEPFLRAVNRARRGALAKSISNWLLIGQNEIYGLL